MEKESGKRICSCGNPLTLSSDQPPSAELRCPKCGRPWLPGDEAEPSFCAGETQMINIEEMARMAQEGVDVGISGEWDTSEPLPEKLRKDE